MNPRPLAFYRRMRVAGPILLLLALVSILPQLAGAHADLQTATPVPNGHADEGLALVEVRFTEGVEREYTSLDVVDVRGESWADGPLEFDEDARNVIRLPLKPLPSGIYAANWKALSADTHTTRGTFLFAIGNATLRGQPAPLASDPTEHDTASVTRDGFARFAFYLGLFLAVGMPFFAFIVERDAQPPRSLFGTAAAFGIVGAAGALTGLLFLADRTGLGAGVLGTSPGRSLALRGALVALAAIAAWIAFLRPERWRSAAIASVALGAGAIVATSTGSHAAALSTNAWAYVLADMVHLAMAAIWLGGVASFLHLGPSRSALDIAGMIHRFSPYAVASVALLLATGALASLVHIPCIREEGLACLPESLRTERYARLVAVKLSLMVPLVALGAYHKFRAGPRLARGATGPHFFRRLVVVEATTMAAVLVAAGMLAASAPPDRGVETAEEIAPPYLELQTTTAKSHVIVQVHPNPVTVGLQRVIVIVHPLGASLPNGTLVALKAWPASGVEPEDTMNPRKVSPNEWEIESALFTEPGDWKLMVILQRSDEYTKPTFDIPVALPGAQTAS